MANLATRLDRRRMRIERATRRLLRREFARYARAAAANQPNFHRATIQHAARIASILAAAYEPSILLGVESVEDQLAKAGRPVEEKQTPALEATTDRLLFEYIESVSFQRAASISKTSRAAAQRALDTAIAEGLSERATADLIREAIGEIAPWRARTIARTETHSAMMNSSFQAADTLGATAKEWVAIEDERTRETHQNADGQEVLLNEGFQVGEAVLRFPGDPSGPPEETINCRCAVAYA